MSNINDPSFVSRALQSLLTAGDLPDPLPADPMPLFQQWFDAAKASKHYADPNAMTLATATADGMPSARIVLCKGIEHSPPAIVFFTNYNSRKGAELESNPHAAAVFHWPNAQRQVRIEGSISRTSAAESDEYFQTRSLLSRVGAVVSQQSRPVGSRAQLIQHAMMLAGEATLGKAIARPPHWGGFRISISALELWSARDGRLHDRARWTRHVSGTWVSEHLCP